MLITVHEHLYSLYTITMISNFQQLLSPLFYVLFYRTPLVYGMLAIVQGLFPLDTVFLLSQILTVFWIILHHCEISKSIELLRRFMLTSEAPLDRSILLDCCGLNSEGVLGTLVFSEHQIHQIVQYPKR